MKIAIKRVQRQAVLGYAERAQFGAKLKTTKFFLMAALALTFAACSNDDNDILTPAQPAKAEGIPFTATISIDNGAATRAITESGSTLETSWAQNDKVALIHNGVSDVMTVSSVSGGVATITGTITGSPSGSDPVTIIYPSAAADGATGNVKSDLLAAQDGTLTGTSGTSIAEKYDVRKGSGTLNATGTSLSGTVTLTNQNAIFKLTLKNIDATADVSATSVKIYNQENTLLTTVTPASSYEKVMYVALPTTATTLKFSVTDGTTNYFNMASSLSLAANYYQSTIKLATVGDVILSSGKCAKAGTSGAVAMIAYLGNGSDCTNGLAIQLNSSPESKKWADGTTYPAKEYAEGLTAVPGGTWRLPSKADWQNMFLGCATSGDASASDYMDPIAGFKAKIAATGTTWLSYYYWSSTDSGSDAWSVYVRLDDSYAYANFVEDDTSDAIYVLGCLAF